MKEFITWPSFHESVVLLTNNIKNDFDTKDYDIVGVSRGGLFLAASLAYSLRIKRVYSIGLQSYTNREQSSISVYQHINLGNIRNNIIIVDDISDTGETFIYTEKVFVDKTIKTVSLAVKDKTKYWPDYSAFAFKSDIWVVFPWDNN